MLFLYCLLLPAGVWASFSEIYCYFEGHVEENNVLNGSLSVCRPDVVVCSLVDEDALDPDIENVECVEEGHLWNEKSYCAFMHFSRKSFCNHSAECYGIRMKCPRFDYEITTLSWILLCICGILLVASAAAFLMIAVAVCRRSNTFDVRKTERKSLRDYNRRVSRALESVSMDTVNTTM